MRDALIGVMCALIGAGTVSLVVLIAVHVAFKRVNPCGGMVADGVCSKRLGHRGKC